MTNRNFHAAKADKNDEFYTQLETIEKELKHYSEHFRDKVVYLNCDDPRESNFFTYFKDNFDVLGLKELIVSCYKEDEPAVWLRYSTTTEATTVNPVAPDDEQLNYFVGDGDFRSQESISLLKEADIVVTNPPFSLFREFVAQMVEYDKKFLIIGNQNAITYKETFPLIKDDKVWLGVAQGDMAFKVPDNYEPRKTRYWVDAEGQKWRSFGNINWWTNLEHSSRKKDLILECIYVGNEDKYPTYDNYDAINVDKVAEIPNDYSGVIGVPISFLHKYNPEQFEIVKFRKGDDNKDLRHNGKTPYFRVLVRSKHLTR